MDFRIVLNREEQVVESLVGAAAGQRSEGSLGEVHVLGTDGVAENLAPGLARRQRFRRNRVQDLVAATATFLDPAGVAIEHLDDGQRLPRRGSSRAMWKAGAKAIMVWKPT